MHRPQEMEARSVTMKFSAALLFAGLALVAAKPRGQLSNDYNGAQVLRVNANTMSGLHYLNWLQQHTSLDFWTEPRKLGIVDVLARRWELPMLKTSLTRHGVEYEVHVSNVAQLLAKEIQANKEARTKSPKTMDWTSYHRFNEINDWLDSLVVDYPAIASVSDVGTSYEGRTMKLLKLSTGGSGKEVIFIDGGIHAREWISPATVTYIINQLVSGNDGGILDTVDFYFMPVINPDGYAYTFSDDRFWRKTRSENPEEMMCPGKDPNRNWGFHWMEGGASDDPCSQIYAGLEPFSEVEMRVVRDQLLALKPRVYLTYHSYSQVWVYPWGYTPELPDNWQDLDALAQDAVAALTAVHGTAYDIGTSTNTISLASGGSDDWAMGVGGAEYSYTIELRDQGQHGFDLPPEQIIATGEENFEAFKVVAEFIATLAKNKK